ncbi:hypothetical protein LWI28_025337 [Acer negundo]|uniref:Uncharacterized protein n=1 Tax=Acer negundo TaxID=4023 RepID=A0AAD5P0C6_ACENE|nr:hypothetical protein LWI28_004187 [Acer negundo]KAI9192603.1 hypothetical protein LWI28_025337 [Acer negundo]KAK4854296.1 hypothetical protein QYF36_021863 [Acer negundo]
MGGAGGQVRRRLKTAVRNLNLVLRILKQGKWWLASICGSVSSFSVRISWSFDVSLFVRDLDLYRFKMNSDQYIGLHYTEDQEFDENCSSVQELQRATSFTSYYSCTDDDDVVNDDVNIVDDDIDKRAEIFISNFRHHLLYERQISQQRYGQVNSFEFLTEIQECFY